MKKLSILFILMPILISYAQSNCSVEHYSSDIYRVLEKRMHDVKSMLVAEGAYPYLEQAFYNQADHLSIMLNQTSSDDGQDVHILEMKYDISFEHEGQHHTLNLGLVNHNKELELAYTTPIYFRVEGQASGETEAQVCRFDLSVVEKVWDDKKKIEQIKKIENPSLSLFASQNSNDSINEALFNLGHVVFAQEEQVSENILPLLKQSQEDTVIAIYLEQKESASLTLLSEVIKKNEKNKNQCSENAMGEPCMMNYMQAKKYCEQEYAGLPTILELAEFYNAGGVTVFDNPYRQFKMAVMSKTTESSASKVEFYYTLETYKGQSLYDLSLWSSLDVPYKNGYKAYVFNLADGDINGKLKSKKLGVVCRMKD
ncbi:hypothetical protein MRY82_06235 [bacterium]|nr:hypothetical protein [bacterium]